MSQTIPVSRARRSAAPASDPLAVSVTEAQRLTSIGTTSLYALMRAGKLKSHRVGGKRLIDYQSLRTLVTPES